MINDRQFTILWKEFLITKIIKTSALKSGMNRKTASKYLKQSTLPSESKKEGNSNCRLTAISLMIIKIIFCYLNYKH